MVIVQQLAEKSFQLATLFDTFAGYMSYFWRYISVVIICLSISNNVQAQVSWPTPEVGNLYREARQFHNNGNLREAIVRYQQAIQIAPDIVLLYRDLAQAYYLAKGYNEAMSTLQPIIDQGKADAETYKIMAQSLIATNEQKKAKKLLREAVEQNPNSGSLYHVMGRMYMDDNEVAYALESWLDGIEKDPGYHLNYYEAATTYMNTDKVVWAIIYGEMFINMEQQTRRSHDIRLMVFEAYKKLYSSLSTGDMPKFGANDRDGMVGFEEAVYDTYIKLSPVVSDGIYTENLIMLRTRFLMDWTLKYAAKYPFTLFARHDQMLRDGYFDIYNQWLFGKVENLQQYDTWNKFHENAIPQLEAWLQRHPYRPVLGDFYNDKMVDGIFNKTKNSKR